MYHPNWDVDKVFNDHVHDSMMNVERSNIVPGPMKKGEKGFFFS